MPATYTDRLEGLTTSLAVKAPCQAVAIANITLSGEQTVNGVAVTSGDRVLATAQTNAVDNGIWVVGAGTWARSKDFDGSRDAVQGTLVSVFLGGTESVLYQLVTADPIVIGTTALDFDPATWLSQVAFVTADEISDVESDLEAINDKLSPYQKHWVTRYGATGDGSTNDATSITATTTAVNLEKITLAQTQGNVDYTDPAYVPVGEYLINTDVTLPHNAVCYGRYTGAGKLFLPFGQQNYYRGLASDGGVSVENGMFLGRIDGCFGDLTIKSGGAGFGSFWNWFSQINGNVTSNPGTFSNNFNVIGPVHGGVDFIGSAVLDQHANLVFMADITNASGTGLTNTDNKQQTNWAIGLYYESGKRPVGNFHIMYFHGDDDSPPLVHRDNHLLGSTNVIERNRSDFLAYSDVNIAAGGDWDYLDSSGKPSSLSTFSSATATVSTDITEPSGAGKKYECTFTSSFSGLTITVPPTQTERGTAFIYFQGTDPELVEVSRGGGGGTSYYTTRSVDMGTGWKLLRVSFNTVTGATTTIKLYAYTSVGGASRTLTVGGYFVTQEKAARLPASLKRPARRVNNAIAVHNRATVHGSTTQAYIATPTTVNVTVSFGTTFASAPVVTPGLQVTGAPSRNMTKIWVESVSTTGCVIRVTYATDFQGEITWVASGELA